MKLVISASPHIDSGATTRKIMGDVLIALCPALIAAVIIFGWRALLVTAVCAAACVFFEWGFEKLCHKPSTIDDLSAVVTGVILAYNLPVSIPLWQAVFGCLVAIVAVKQLFGGLGKNFLNPALAARAFLMLCYPVDMTTWAKAGVSNWAPLGMSVGQEYIDAFTGATPLSADFMHSGIMPDVSLGDMFVGNIGGTIGEISALMLLIGGVYLIARGVIRIRIPVSFIATVAVLTFLFPLNGNGNLTWMLYEILGGGLFLGAFFMATDYVTSPVTKRGEIVYGVGCGLLTVFIRYFGGYPEGVSYAILLMNICVWLIDKYCRPNRYGVTAEMRQAEKAKAKASKGGDAK